MGIDVPDERRVHAQLIPSLGGIGIFIVGTIHHEFIRSKVVHLQTSMFLWIGNVLMISAVLFFRNQNTTTLIFVVITVGVVFIHELVYLRF